jgi:hypothetical protein
VNKLITVYWRDIPAQVIGRKGRKSVSKKVLDPRFQHAIDRAAMRARKVSEDAYLEDWRRVSTPCDGDVEQAVQDEACRLESEYSADLLDTLARAGGRSSTSIENAGEQTTRAKD